MVVTLGRWGFLSCCFCSFVWLPHSVILRSTPYPFLFIFPLHSLSFITQFLFCSRQKTSTNMINVSLVPFLESLHIQHVHEEQALMSSLQLQSFINSKTHSNRWPLLRKSRKPNQTNVPPSNNGKTFQRLILLSYANLVHWQVPLR